MAELTAIGPESYHRWQKPLPDGETVRLGRAPRHGWKVAWDYHISREHADLTWENGQLLVDCLESARNLVHAGGRDGKRFRLEIGESFRIGMTRFLISASAAEPELVQEITFDGQDSDENPRDASRRLERVMQLPRIISGTRNDEELAEQLTGLLLKALPHIRAAATIRFDSLEDVEAGRQAMTHWDSRETIMAPFIPSTKLIRSAFHQERGVLHYFLPSAASDSQYTLSAGLDWAICTPITTSGPDYWCLYVAGASDSKATKEGLRDDLRFISLMAQLIGSIRQVRQLEKVQAGLSQFFSPAILENLAKKSGEEVTRPRICEVSVLFCDVRGFSRMTERAADDLFPLLDRVSAALGLMTSRILKYDGVIADFQGDAALGFWGWPLAPDESALPACRAALAITDGFLRANATPEHQLQGIQVGIGLSHGRAIAGRIGSNEQVKVGVFGPRVNLGARLQGLSKDLGATILVDEATAMQVRTEMPPTEGRCRRLGRFVPAGMKEPVEVSELLPPEGDTSHLTHDDVATFEAAVDALTAGKWPKALRLFQALPPSDGPTTYFRQLLRRHDNTAPADWNGSIVLTGK